VNGRSILPMVPAVAILTVRHLERRRNASTTAWPVGMTAGLTLGALLAMLVTWSDCQMARAARLSAQATEAEAQRGAGTLWFEGHWGFQYYLGPDAKISNYIQPAFKEGDFLAIPENNSYVPLPTKEEHAQRLEVIDAHGPRWLSTLNKAVGAGFYASAIGPLPFAIGRVPPEKTALFVIGPAPKGPQ
jgi:hypothetical protein